MAVPTPGWSLRLLPLPIAVMLSGCAHLMGQTVLSDGNIMKTYGYGSDVGMSWQYLAGDTINQLTGSQIAPNITKADSYIVVTVSSKSSDISNAVSDFAKAADELKTTSRDVANAAKAAVKGPAPVVVQSPPPPVGAAPGTASVANAIAAAAIKPDSSAAQAAATASPLLSPENKAVVKQELQDISKTTPSPSVSAKIRDAADKL
jgi:hypothetical protein